MFQYSPLSRRSCNAAVSAEYRRLPTVSVLTPEPKVVQPDAHRAERLLTAAFQYSPLSRRSCNASMRGTIDPRPGRFSTHP